MNRSIKASVLGPFQVVSFRFQWPADLLTSWAFEMETLILGWFILVETGSVMALTVFASLQFLGTLIAPMIGVLGDRHGRRTMLCAMRATYLALAAALAAFAQADMLSAHHVFAIAFLAGLVRPSDLVMRNALIGDTMPADRLMNAIGVSRTTMDTARIAGALIGAGLFSAFGMVASYAVVTAFYAASLLLTLGVSGRRNRPETVVSPWGDLRGGLGYVWTTPVVLAAMWLAFLVNLTIFPITHGLLPYVAKEVYMVDENGLGHLVASYAVGALLGSLTMTIFGRRRRPSRFMMVTMWLMFASLLVFGQLEIKSMGQAVLALSGYAQSLSMIAMAVTLLSVAGPRHRGLVMGVRMLAVYGLPLGLWGTGVAIEWLGFPTTVTLYGIVGLSVSILITIHWRRELWFGIHDDQ